MTDIEKYTKDEIKAHLEIAIATLQDRDVCFLDPAFDINERSVTHRLAMYLEDCFQDQHVDCEYNRTLDPSTQESISKKIAFEVNEGVTWSDTEARTVFPDIIVHERGTSRNLLAIEVKMGWKDMKAEFDRIKAIAYKTQLGYKFSVCVTLGPGSSYDIFFIDE